MRLNLFWAVVPSIFVGCHVRRVPESFVPGPELLPPPAEEEPRVWDSTELSSTVVSSTGTLAVGYGVRCSPDCVPTVVVDFSNTGRVDLAPDPTPLAALTRQGPTLGVVELAVTTSRGELVLPPGQSLRYDLPVSWFLRPGPATSCESAQTVEQAERFSLTPLTSGFDVQVRVRIDDGEPLESPIVHVPIVVCD